MAAKRPAMTSIPFDWIAYRRGMRAAVCTGGIVLSASFIGFGALVNASGLAIVDGLLMTTLIWQLPGQVVLTSLMGSGAGLLTAAFAVTLTAVRLMPMVVAILPDMTVPGRPRILYFLIGHFTAATVWLESRRAFPSLETSQRLPFMLGLGSVFMSWMLLMMCAGYYLAGQLAPLLAACLVFLTPAYFLVGLLAAAHDRLDYLSVGLGAALFGAFHVLVPEFDLVLAGVIGGTIAFVFGRLKPQRGGHG